MGKNIYFIIFHGPFMPAEWPKRGNVHAATEICRGMKIEGPILSQTLPAMCFLYLRSVLALSLNGILMTLNPLSIMPTALFGHGGVSMGVFFLYP